MLTIIWRKVKVTPVNHEKMNELLDDVHALEAQNKIRRVEFFPCNRALYLRETYQLKVNESGVELRISWNYNNNIRYQYNKSTQMFTKQEEERASGAEAYKYIDDEFKLRNKKTVFTAFSGLKYKEQYRAIKKCVPIQVSYLNNRISGKIVDNIYKADVSSCFPSEIVNHTLPTLHNCKIINGKVEPTKDYPFAFYTKSHHISILNELDTHTFKNRYYDYYNEVYDDSVKDEDEITILCQASVYNLDNELKLLYNKRKENSDFKFYMNAFIGYFHKNGNPTLSHIAAVTIARANNNMFNRCKKLREENNIILFIATDSIAWKGNLSNIAIDEKYLGSFTYECKNGRFFGNGKKSYQVELSNGTVINKYAGMPNGSEKNAIKFGELPEAKICKMLITDSDGYTTEI